MMSALQSIEEQLGRLGSSPCPPTYRVPGLWAPVGQAPTPAPRIVVPATFFLEHIRAIRERAAALPTSRSASGSTRPGGWVASARIYNLFVRHTTAYDHDGDGELGTTGAAPRDRAARTTNAQGVRETGTFLKAIALLGHIVELGCTAVHLLPVTAVGSFGNKGVLGSPYAIQDPYRLEPTLADPLIEADVDTQLAAFVEACHLLGLKVIVEFVFRTSSRDGSWVRTQPGWYYWIRREIEDRPTGAAPDDPRYYGVPPFPASDLALLKDKVQRGDLHELPAPPAWYRDLFRPAPAPERIEQEADGRYVGTLDDGTRVHIPGAFADWPPDDYQPPWTDVTYLKVYNDPPEGPSFDYIAYNTIRMYDERLARPENANQPLWDAICGIIPHFVRTYGVDGVMVDMGHALPHALMHRIIGEARAVQPDLALLSENFHIGADSLETGYNAVLGYQFMAVAEAAQMRRLIERSCAEGLPIPAFGTPETHNTPRAAMRNRGAAFCATLWLLNNLLPDTIPFIHSGFELAERRPVNLGLAFTPDETAELSQQPLGLFDVTSLDWDRAGDLPQQLAHIARICEGLAPLVQARGPQTFSWLDAGHDDILAFWRCAPGTEHAPLLVLLSWDTQQRRDFRVRMPAGVSATVLQSLLDGGQVELADGHTTLCGERGPGEGRLNRPAG